MKMRLEAEQIDDMRCFGARKNHKCTRSTLRIFPREKQAYRNLCCLIERIFIV
jgi:hypothetical protein